MATTTTTNAMGELQDRLLDQYRAELERLDYSRGTIATYLHAVRRLLQILVARGITVGDLTPDLAAELMQHDATRAGRRPYGMFIAQRFATHLTVLGVAK